MMFEAPVGEAVVRDEVEAPSALDFAADSVLEAPASADVSVTEGLTLDGVIAVKIVVVFFGLRDDFGSSELDDNVGVGVGDGSLEVALSVDCAEVSAGFEGFAASFELEVDEDTFAGGGSMGALGVSFAGGGTGVLDVSFAGGGCTRALDVSFTGGGGDGRALETDVGTLWGGGGGGGGGCF